MNLFSPLKIVFFPKLRAFHHRPPTTVSMSQVTNQASPGKVRPLLTERIFLRVGKLREKMQTADFHMLLKVA